MVVSGELDWGPGAEGSPFLVHHTLQFCLSPLYWYFVYVIFMMIKNLRLLLQRKKFFHSLTMRHFPQPSLTYLNELSWFCGSESWVQELICPRLHDAQESGFEPTSILHIDLWMPFPPNQSKKKHFIVCISQCALALTRSKQNSMYNNSVLPGESQGWRSLVGCRLWRGTESDTTEAT